MTDTAARLGEAVEALAAGREGQSLEILRVLVESTDDPDVIDEIRNLAVEAHESSQGLHRIEWKRLAIDAESREMLSVRR